MSGRINLSNLSDSLKEHLNGLGLTEEQVNAIVQEAIANINAKDLSQDEAMEIIQSAVDKAQGEVDAVELEVDALQEFVNGHSHATIEQNITNLQNNVNDIVDKVGELNGLMTGEKGDLVGAINELFQSANNGKELIASAIGEPLSSEDTFSAMSDKINTMKSDLKQVLTDEGVSVTEEDDMASLITKVDSEFTDKENEISDLETELAGKVTPAGTAVESDVRAGKTFINSTGELIKGTANIPQIISTSMETLYNTGEVTGTVSDTKPTTVLHTGTVTVPVSGTYYVKINASNLTDYVFYSVYFGGEGVYHYKGQNNPYEEAIYLNAGAHDVEVECDFMGGDNIVMTGCGCTVTLQTKKGYCYL